MDGSIYMISTLILTADFFLRLPDSTRWFGLLVVLLAESEHTDFD
jgi:hypothetical protein